MQAFFDKAAAQNKIAYFDKGAYIARKTIQISKDTKIVGELWAIIMSQGPFFGDQSNPQPMWRIGTFFSLPQARTIGNKATALM
jgi:glucan 1,3-beta-glucosidase